MTRPTAEAGTAAPSWEIPETVLRHTLRPGESLVEIAGRYDEGPRWVREWNRLTPADDKGLHVGGSLTLRALRRPPPREAVEITLREGERLADRAPALGLDAKVWARHLRRKAQAPFERTQALVAWRDPTLAAWVARDAAHPPAAPQLAAIAAGAWSVGAPDDGALANAVRIPDDPRWSLRFEHRAYGSTDAVRATVAALTEFRERSGYNGPLRVWSMSRHYGGPLPDHHSHQSGRDLDVKLPLRPDLPATIAVQGKWIDALALWHLLAAFVATGAVDAIFLDHAVQARVHAAALDAGIPRAELDALLQYPRPSLAEAGVVRHAPGHDDHFHVRFRCPPWGVFCTDR